MSAVDQALAAEKFIANPVHEQRLDKILWAARLRRDQAASQVPEWETLRELASQIKEHTLSHLAHYLEQFEASAKANGVIVHWAGDRQRLLMRPHEAGGDSPWQRHSKRLLSIADENLAGSKRRTRRSVRTAMRRAEILTSLSRSKAPKRRSSCHFDFGPTKAGN